jgi:hypothetical protein
MNNPKFHSLLKDRTDWTVAKMAAAIYCSRSRVVETLNNKPNRGRQIRPKLVRFFKAHFQRTLPETGRPAWLEILKTLGWREDGSLHTAGINEMDRVESATGNIPQGTLGAAVRVRCAKPKGGLVRGNQILGENELVSAGNSYVSKSEGHRTRT